MLVLLSLVFNTVSYLQPTHQLTNEVAAELSGIDVARYRVYGALIGSAMLGLAGAVYAMTEGRMSPTTFGFGEVDVVELVMLAFGSK